MNPDRLLKHFDQISEAPDAVPRLRRFILDLAVRGKLLPQDPNDRPASELLKRIEAEKKLLMKAGARRTHDSLSLIDVEATSLQTPREWEWVRLEAVAHVEMGQSPSSEFYNQRKEGLPFYQGKADFGKLHPTPRYWCTDPKKLAEKGDILISVRAPVGPTNVATETCCIGRGLASLRPQKGYERDFLLLCLKKFEYELATLGAGTTFVAINRNHLANFPIPLPPLAEQHRIVAKVDELMALCDELEVAQAQRERRGDRLVASTLTRLTTEPSPPPSASSVVSFFLKHILRLTNRPEHIKQLRQTILNSAVRGKLVPQDSNDEAVDSLLKRVAEEKKRRVKDLLLKQQNWIAPKLDTATLPNLPNSWRWVHVQDLVSMVTVGHVGPMADRYHDSGIPFLRSQNVRPNRFEPIGLAFIDEHFHSELKKSQLCGGDVVIVRSGNVGVSCVIPASLGTANCADLVIVKQPLGVDSRFLCYYLNSVTESRIQEGKVGIALSHFNTKSVALLAIPLPPLAEQHRIVAKVDELMALCDELEGQITSIASTRRRLLEAIVEEVLGTN